MIRPTRPLIRSTLFALALLATSARGLDALDTIVDSAAVAPGLGYARYEEPGIVAHVLTLDLKSAVLKVRSVKAKGKETLGELSERLGDPDTRVLAGINGDFFRQSTDAGLPYGVQVSDGRLIFGPMNRSMIGFGPNNEPFLGIATLKAKVSFAAREDRAKETWYRIDDVNEIEQEDKRRTGIYLYTPAFLGLNVNRPKGTIAVIEKIEPALQVGDVCEGLVARVETSDTPVDVPAGGCLLYFFGDAHRAVAAALKPGRPVALKLDLPPVATGIAQAIGGGPRLVRDGKVSVELQKESFEPAHAMEISKRHPRSAIGFDKAKQTLFLVMVEGRHEKSRGMTFGELATFLTKLGCWQAMAFDGGGSAGMFVAERGIVSQSMGAKNQPEERALANAFFITTPRATPSPAGTTAPPPPPSIPPTVPPVAPPAIPPVAPTEPRAPGK